jgi:hypothetical protein
MRLEREPLAAPEQVEHGFDEGVGRRPRPPEQRRVGRFSEGIESDPDAERRRGRFSEGAEKEPDDPEHAVERRFREGVEHDPIAYRAFPTPREDRGTDEGGAPLST